MVTGTVTVPHEALNVTLYDPAIFLDLSVKVAATPPKTICDPPGETCRSEDLLDDPVIEIALKLVCAMTTVVVPSKPSETDPGTAVSTHGSIGVAVGDGDGVGAGVGVGVAVGAGVGVGVGIGGGVGVDCTGGVGVAIGVGVGVAVTGPGSGNGGAMTPCEAGVPDGARLPTLRFTCGTASSNTRLSIVTSPEPVTSADADVVPFVTLIET